jgi:hypothetical protein
LLDWLRADPSLDLDAVARKLATVVPGPEAERVGRAKDYVKQLYRSMADQGLLEANDFASLVQFASERSTDFALPRELRPKNAYNLVRLLATATGWLAHGTPTFELRGELRDRIFAIKRGEVPLAEVLAAAEAMTPALERARDASPLARRPDVARADALARRIAEELARRWVEREPGPFGAEAPLPPEVTWNEET